MYIAVPESKHYKAEVIGEVVRAVMPWAFALLATIILAFAGYRLTKDEADRAERQRLIEQIRAEREVKR